MSRGVTAIVQDASKFNNGPGETVQDKMPGFLDEGPGNSVPTECEVVNPGIWRKVRTRLCAGTTRICMKVAQRLTNQCGITVCGALAKPLFALCQDFSNVAKDRWKVER
ncbi:MAG TPA: hypothetical protein VGN16_00880 [Acidobacteriaceae bacterium]|jgi:hypothetical protein